MDDYKPNSHRSKEIQKQSIEDKKKVEKVVNGKVKVKKKGIFEIKILFIRFFNLERC